MCVICMKYRIIILIIIIISLGKILLSYIANTSHTHIRRRARAHTHTPPSLFRFSLFEESVAPDSGGIIVLFRWFRWRSNVAELRRELLTGCTVSRYEQVDISPETIEQELRPAVYEITVNLIYPKIECLRY